MDNPIDKERAHGSRTGGILGIGKPEEITSTRHPNGKGRDAASLVNATGEKDLAVARGLGWFSIGLGLLEVTAAESIARWLGMEERAQLIRLYGVREIGAGVGLLSASTASKYAAPWVWGRVGGDALDLATLGSGLGDDNPQKGNAAAAFALVAGVTLVDVVYAQRLSAGA